MSKEAFFRIFDAKVQSVLLYSSEIWGCSKLDSMEKVHLLACKRFLGVPLKTPNRMVYGELGRFPLYVNSTMRCIKYWLRLLNLEETRLPRQAYNMLLLMDKNGKICWVSQIREILCRLGFGYIWLNQGTLDQCLFLQQLRQRLIDEYYQEWYATIRDRDRYADYRMFKHFLHCETYLSCIDLYCFRVAFTQLRLNALPLNNNLHRYSENASLRNCVMCEKEVEDEKHLLYDCVMYTDLRENMLSSYLHLPYVSLLNGMNAKMSLCLAKYVFHAMKRRIGNANAT